MNYSNEEHIFRPKQKYISAIQWDGTNLKKVSSFVDMELITSDDKHLIIPKFNSKHQFVTSEKVANLNDFIIRENGQVYFMNEYDFLNQYEIVE